MIDRNQNSKNSAQEDLDLVRKAIVRSRSDAIEFQVTNAEVKKTVEKNLGKEVNDIQFKQVESGYQALIEEITKNTIDECYSRNADIKPIPITHFQISPDKIQALKKIVSDEIISTDAIDDIVDFSTEVQLLFYEIGIYFYEQANYEKSINAFIFLITINPNVQSFWIGLALGYEKNLNFNKAIESLEAAIKCEPTDFTPYYGLIRCCEAIKDFRKIKEMLEAAKDNEAIKNQAAEVLEYLKIKK